MDNLVAHHVSALETLVESMTHSYLSTVTDEGDEVIECPKCKHEFVPEDDDGDLLEPGDAVECPECKHEFVVPDDYEGEDGDGDEDESA